MSTSSQNPGALAPMEPRRIEALDAPLAPLEAHGVLSAAASRTHSPSDRLAYLMELGLTDRPDCYATEADAYPWWTPAMGCCPTHTVGGAA